jgi:hypothetical protein
MAVLAQPGGNILGNPRNFGVFAGISWKSAVSTFSIFPGLEYT